MVSLFYLVVYRAFLALIFHLKFYAALSSAGLNGVNYCISIYSVYRGFKILKEILYILFMLEPLLRGYSGQV